MRGRRSLLVALTINLRLCPMEIPKTFQPFLQREPQGRKVKGSVFHQIFIVQPLRGADQA